MNPHRDKNLVAAAAKVEEAAKAYRQTVYDTVIACKHEHIGECSYYHMEHTSSLPPRRTCLCCGLSEDGWGCGYYVLNTAHPQKWSRDDLYKHATVTLTEDDKGPYIRAFSGQVSLAGLAQLLQKKLKLVPEEV